MYVTVNGARLFFDTVGAHIEPGSGATQTRPVLLVLHGGPGWDHGGFRSYFDRFADTAQVVYLDHRGNGRSRGSGGSNPATWNLAQWGDDIAAFCDTVGIEHPIVYGQSFGGMVAQSYAVRHPGHAGALVFSSTAATFDLAEVLSIFESLGGPAVRGLAHRFWTRMSDDDVAEYLQVCLPLYNYGYGDAIPMNDGLFRPDVLRHFSSAGGEIHLMDLRPGLETITAPVLVVTGDRDPVTPPVRAQEIHSALPPHARYAEIADAGHGAYRDQPGQVEALLRSFLAEVMEVVS